MYIWLYQINFQFGFGYIKVRDRTYKQNDKFYIENIHNSTVYKINFMRNKYNYIQYTIQSINNY